MHQIHVQIVTYNSASTIEACLRALRQQDADFSARVIDNASTDETAAKVEALGVPCTRNPVNLGYAAAHNQGLALDDSAYVLTLNPDVTLMPGYLRHVQQALDETPDAGSAAGRLLRVDALGEQPRVVDSTGLFIRRNRRQGLRDEGAPAQQAHRARGATFGPDGAAAFYRRTMLDDIRVGGDVFDADFFMHKEDIDLCWRAQLRGWRSIYVPEAVAHHIRRFRPGQRQRVSDDLRCYAVRNRYLLLLKNDIPAHFWRDIVPIALYELAIFGYLLAAERGSLRAYRDAWRLRRKMLAKRRVIQQRRKVDWRQMRRMFE